MNETDKIPRVRGTGYEVIWHEYNGNYSGSADQAPQLQLEYIYIRVYDQPSS